MASKTDVQVLLGGKVYTLSGYESEEYLQKIALYINNKMTELNQMPGYKRMGSDMQKLCLSLIWQMIIIKQENESASLKQIWKIRIKLSMI